MATRGRPRKTEAEKKARKEELKKMSPEERLLNAVQYREKHNTLAQLGIDKKSENDKFPKTENSGISTFGKNRIFQNFENRPGEELTDTQRYLRNGL